VDPFEASPQQDPLGAKLCEERMSLMPWDLKSYLGKMSVLTFAFQLLLETTSKDKTLVIGPIGPLD